MQAVTHALALRPVFGEKFPRDRGGREGRTETGALRRRDPGAEKVPGLRLIGVAR